MKRKVIVGIIIAITCFLLVFGYSILFINKKEEPKTETPKIELTKISKYNNPIVPEGFKKVETETASWEMEDDITSRNSYKQKR